ncbi:MAG: prenyltransferase/squalene oxidase repeat-containing protein [Promethearchaeota archaeon]
MFLIILNIVPIVLGKTRKTYLKDFLYNTEVEGEGFKNGVGAGEPINEATAYALEILDFYGLNAHEVNDLTTKLETELESMFDSDNIVLYDIYYLLKSLFLIDEDYEIDASLKNRIHLFINGTEQISGGFSFSNTSTLASMSSTYFVVQIFNLILEPIPNVTIHKNWIILCNNSDGGYGANSSSSSNLLTTYYAVSLLEILSFSVNDLADKNQTLFYLNSFYIQNPSDTNNFGGYLPDLTAKDALIYYTFHCVSAISLIDENMLNKDQTVKWILSRQYFQDGGFADITEGTSQLMSSVVSSYYAFKTLELFGSLGKLNAEVFMVEFNYWILLIIFASIGLVAVIGVIIWRRRRI